LFLKLWKTDISEDLESRRIADSADETDESKPNRRMIKTKTIRVMLMAFSSHRQKIIAARRPSKTPSNGLEMANQKQTSQPESSAIAFIFTLFSQAFEDRHFTEREISFSYFIRWYLRTKFSPWAS
jgi:hypothetical protein